MAVCSTKHKEVETRCACSLGVAVVSVGSTTLLTRLVLRARLTAAPLLTGGAATSAAERAAASAGTGSTAEVLRLVPRPVRLAGVELLVTAAVGAAVSASCCCCKTASASAAVGLGSSFCCCSDSTDDTRREVLRPLRAVGAATVASAVSAAAVVSAAASAAAGICTAAAAGVMSAVGSRAAVALREVRRPRRDGTVVVSAAVPVGLLASVLDWIADSCKAHQPVQTIVIQPCVREPKCTC